MKIQKINTLIYAIYNGYIGSKISGGRIRIGRIMTYQEMNGRILPVVKEVGTPHEINPLTNKFFATLEEAIAALKPKKK